MQGQGRSPGGEGQGRDALPWEKAHLQGFLSKERRITGYLRAQACGGAQAPEGGRGRLRDNPLLHHRQQTHLHPAAATPVFRIPSWLSLHPNPDPRHPPLLL